MITKFRLNIITDILNLFFFLRSLRTIVFKKAGKRIKKESFLSFSMTFSQQREAGLSYKQREPSDQEDGRTVYCGFPLSDGIYLGILD